MSGSATRALLPSLPPNAPRVRANVFTRWLGRTVLRLGGWRVTGEWPNLPHLVVLFAPHSSYQDVVWGLAAKLALGVRMEFVAKQELFRGPLGWLLRRAGGIPVNRSSPRGVVREIADRFTQRPQRWIAIAPEGTRKPVEHWKSGFWRIAREAQVPVLLGYFHYPERRIGVGPVIHLGTDMDADMARIRAFYRPWQGKNRGTV